MLESRNTTSRTAYLSILPILLLLFASTSIKEYPISPSGIDVLTLDTIPDININTDTIITFDSETYVETIEIVKSLATDTKAYLKEIDYSGDVVTVIDTIITFDYDTYKESVTVVQSTYPIEISDLLRNTPYQNHSLIIDYAKKQSAK